MLKVWGRTSSSNVQKVLWCLAEIGLPCERIDAGGAHRVVDTPEYRAMNPNGLVPTIDDDGYILWESNVVVRYLASKHDSGGLCPADPRDRFEAEKWMDWQTTALTPPFLPVFFGLVRTPPEQRDQAAIDKGLKATEKPLAILEAQLAERPFVAGERLTIGDIPIGVWLFRMFELGIAKSAYPNASRYYAALSERPGYKKHVMLPLT